jgi:hypothetical protein
MNTGSNTILVQKVSVEERCEQKFSLWTRSGKLCTARADNYEAVVKHLALELGTDAYVLHSSIIAPRTLGVSF